MVEENVVLNEVTEKTFAKKVKRFSQFLRPTDTGEQLKRLLWQEFELSRIAIGWLPAIPNYETKLMIGRLGYLHNRNVRFLESRIKELPVNFNNNESVVKLVKEAFERLTLAENHKDFLVSYFFILQRLYEQYDELMNRIDPLLDAPTVDQIKLIFIERENTLKWAKDQVRFAYANGVNRSEVSKGWEKYLSVVWNQFKLALDQDTSIEVVTWPIHPVIEPAGPVPNESAWEPERFPLYEGKKSFEEIENGEQSFEGALQRGKNFSDPLMSPLFESVKQMIYINATEIGPAEALCYVYYCTKDMPLEFYYDLARHVWDELRHTEMGVRRIEQLGFTTMDFKFIKGSPGKEITDEWIRDAYSGLTMVAEPCSFTKKRKSAEAFWEFGDDLSAIQTEFDIADERIHVDLGKKWGTELYKKIDEIYTAKELAEKIRIQRLKELGVSDEDFEKVVKSFPMFCGFSTQELNYDKY